MAVEWDASTLREKYGEPLARETFHIRPDLEVIVNYDAGGKVCKFEIPRSTSNQQLDELIDELVPPSVRGEKLLGPHINATGGGHCTRQYFYEKVAISEPYDLDHPDRRKGVTITFNRLGRP